ncbi:hypothetical protein [Bacteroides sp.]|uniref:hypothetical protein n=1 Tax=Bacteroides sp. TaxID=29523 RepID=UPI00261EF6D4|nr:hypothetical protein [Bacteroides sp.]MDD3038838.1 hypothetical protein [Bacteroides sp.]
MDIPEIKRRVDLLKMANNKKYCLIPELAKELKVSKTDLMQFVLDNPKLFHVDNQWSYKDKAVYRSVSGVKFKDTDRVKNKNLGLGIEQVYLSPKDNFRTEEWLEAQIAIKAKYIHISEFDYYGVQGYFISIDKESGSKYKEWLWRNTAAKVEEIQSLGVLHKGVFYTGGYGDSSVHPVDYAISPDGLEKIKQAGWTFNELSPIQKGGK